MLKFKDCLNKDDFDFEMREEIDPYTSDNVVSGLHEHGHGIDTREAALQHPCLDVKKILSSGTFYYSVDFDLTNRLQDR